MRFDRLSTLSIPISFENRSCWKKMGDKSKELRQKISHAETRFRNGFEQIVSLSRHLDLLQSKYNQALKAQQRSFRFTYRIQLSVIEGVRNMFLEYTAKKADELSLLQAELLEQYELTSSDDDLSDYEDDDYDGRSDSDMMIGDDSDTDVEMR